MEDMSYHNMRHVVLCAIVGLSLDKAALTRLARRHELPPRGASSDSNRAFIAVVEALQGSFGAVTSGAVGELFARRSLLAAETLKAIDWDSGETLIKRLHAPMAVDPAGTLWALLADGRVEPLAAAVYHAYRLVATALQRLDGGAEDLEDALRDARDELRSAGHKAAQLTRELEESQRRNQALAEESERLASRVRELEAQSKRGDGRLERELRKLDHELLELRRQVMATPAAEPPRLEPQEGRTTLVECDGSCQVPAAACPLERLKVALVGGLERMEPRYREMVEGVGGRLLFHNGDCDAQGSQRLKASVCAADLVVFITTVNSHNALRVAKGLCAKSGKSFLIARDAGLGSLERLLKVRRPQCRKA